MPQDRPQSKIDAPPRDRSSINGQQIFESACSGCHGLDGRGSERGPDISTRPQIVQLPDQDLKTIFRLGRPAAGMPAFASLGAARIDALLGYLRFLQGQRAAELVPGDATKGKLIFFGKGRCSDCHTIQGQGGFLGSDLSSYALTLSAAEVRSSILDPTNERSGKRMTSVAMRDAQQFTGILRNEDNFSLQLQSPDGAFHFLSKFDVASIETSSAPVMPANYTQVLSVIEIDDLVKYLTTVARAAIKPPMRGPSDDEEN